MKIFHLLLLILLVNYFKNKKKDTLCVGHQSVQRKRYSLTGKNSQK